MSVNITNYVVVGVKLPWDDDLADFLDDHPELDLVVYDMSGEYIILGRILDWDEESDDTGVHVIMPDSVNKAEVEYRALFRKTDPVAYERWLQNAPAFNILAFW